MNKLWKILFNLTIFTLVASYIFMRMINIYNNDTMSATDRQNFDNFYQVMQSQVQTSTQTNTDPLFYSLSGDLTIENKSQPFQMSSTFGVAGKNSMYGIKGFDLKQDKHVLQIKSVTDWLSPYIVKSDSAEPNALASEKFTGGWHGATEDPTGAPTAYMKNYEIYADGSEIIGNTTGNAHVIHIIVNNLMQSYNSKDYVLEEYILYTIQDRTIDVRVKVIALGDATIYKYYGLETQNSNFNGLVHYNYENGTTFSQSVTISSDSGKADVNNKVTHFNLTANDHPFVLSTRLNYSPHLATLPYLTDDEPIAFTEQYGKSYFKLISGRPLKLKTGDSFEWSGSYMFLLE